MEMLIVDYFKSLFSAFEQSGNMEFLSDLRSRVTEQMNDELNRDFSV